MGIRTIFMPILICTGILAFTDTEVDVADDFHSTVYEFFEATGMKNEYDNATINTYAEGIWNRIRKTCERNSEAEEALPKAMKRIQDTKHCIVSVNKSIIFDISRLTNRSVEEPKVDIEPYCSHFSQMEYCLNKFKENNPCLGPAELETFDVYRDGILAPLKFICKNVDKFSNISEPRDKRVKECLERNTEEFRFRSEQEIGNALRKHICDVIYSPEPQHFPWRVPDKDDCTEYEKFLEHGNQALRQCRNPEVTKLNEDLNNEVLVALRCRNLANSQSSPISLIILLCVTVFTVLSF